MGFLSGFAFALFYTFAGIPIARWADRGSRRSIIALGLAVWSAMTAASGPGAQLRASSRSRASASGVGEAAGSPPAHSLISDYFPPERRATALSIYANGVYVGAVIAFLAGGYVETTSTGASPSWWSAWPASRSRCWCVHGPRATARASEGGPGAERASGR